MTDLYRNEHLNLNSPLVGGFAITTSDTANFLRPTRQIRVTGTAGDISVVWFDDSTTVEPVSVGDVFDWRIKRINATGTTATGLRGYY